MQREHRRRRAPHNFIRVTRLAAPFSSRPRSHAIFYAAPAAAGGGKRERKRERESFFFSPTPARFARSFSERRDKSRTNAKRRGASRRQTKEKGVGGEGGGEEGGKNARRKKCNASLLREGRGGGQRGSVGIEVAERGGETRDAR